MRDFDACLFPCQCGVATGGVVAVIECADPGDLSRPHLAILCILPIAQTALQHWSFSTVGRLLELYAQLSPFFPE